MMIKKNHIDFFILFLKSYYIGSSGTITQIIANKDALFIFSNKLLNSNKTVTSKSK